jgi:hypothetical protein
MSKNLTRKGLALGAIVALGASLFSGAPAFAGVESAKISLVPSAGTTYNTLVGAQFSLKTELDPTLKSVGLENKNLGKLTYLVTNSSGATLTLGFKGAGGAGTAISWDSADLAADIVAGSGTVSGTPSSVQTTKKAIVVRGTATNSGDSIDKNTFTVQTTTDNTDNFGVTVQAWIDDNGDGLIGTYELTSIAREIKFIQAATVTVTTTVTSAEINATTIAGKVVLGNEINQANTPGIKIGFKNNGTIIGIGTLLDRTLDSTDTTNKGYADTTFVTAQAGYINTQTAVAAISAGTVVAQAYFGTTTGGYPAKLGTSSAAQAPANSTVSVDSTDALEVTATKDVVTGAKSTNTATVVRTGYAGEIKFSSTVTWKSTDTVEPYKAVGAGVKVRITLSKVALASASTFTVGSAVLTATSGDVYAYTTTAADGTVSFTGKGTGAKDDSVKVSIDAVTINAGYTSGNNSKNTLTWNDTALKAYVSATDNAVVNTNLAGASAALKVARGSSYTLTYNVRDQFSQPVTSDAYRLAISTSGNADFTYYAAVTAGVASQVVVDNAVSANSYNVLAQLQKLTSGTWAPVTNQSSTVAVNSNSVVAAAITGAKSSTAAVATITKTLVTKDLRVDASTSTQTLIGYGATATETISGVVSDASGAGVAGAVVTVTGAGLGFVVNNNVYSVGSATVNADSNGAYSVKVYSNTAGKISVTVASGAVSKAVALEFSGVTTTANTNVITVDVAALTQVGRAVTVTVKVVDKFGNPVVGLSPALTLTGVGSLSSVAPAATDKTGVTTVQFLAGANDFGDAVITAKYTGVDAAGADAVVSATKTISVGVTDAQIDVVKNRVTAVASFTKGRTVGFYVDGVKKWSKLSASDADVVLNYNLKKGTHTVTVKISGGFITSEVIVVK